MPKQKITFRDIDPKDKTNIFNLFKSDNNEQVENTAYLMLGLNALSEEKLFKRMVKSDVKIVELNGEVFIGLIETVPYDKESLELRAALNLTISIKQEELSEAIDEYIIDILKVHGVKRIIVEVSKQNDRLISHLILSGYRVITTINNSMTLEFDFAKFNQIK